MGKMKNLEDILNGYKKIYKTFSEIGEEYVALLTAMFANP